MFEGMILGALVTANVVIASDEDYILLARDVFPEAGEVCEVVQSWPPEEDFTMRSRAGSWYAVWTSDSVFVAHVHDEDGRKVRCER